MEWVGGQIPAMQERNMAGIDAALDRLQVVRLLPPLGGDAMRRGQMHPLEARQRRPLRRRGHVGADDAAQLHARVRRERDALAYAAFFRLGGEGHALVAYVVLAPGVLAARSRIRALSISILPLNARSLVSSRMLLTLSKDHRSSVSLAARCAPATGSTFSRSFSLRSASVKGFLWCPGNGRASPCTTAPSLSSISTRDK